MLVRRSTLVAITVLLLTVQQSYCRGNDDNAAVQLNQKLLGMVKNILGGNDISATKSSLAPRAQLVTGTSLKDLHAVVNGELKGYSITEGHGVKYLFENLITSDDRTAAIVLVKTSSPAIGERIHSIVFFRKPNGDWKIASWHISK